MEGLKGHSKKKEIRFWGGGREWGSLYGRPSGKEAFAR